MKFWKHQKLIIEIYIDFCEHDLMITWYKIYQYKMSISVGATIHGAGIHVIGDNSVCVSHDLSPQKVQKLSKNLHAPKNRVPENSEFLIPCKESVTVWNITVFILFFLFFFKHITCIPNRQKSLIWTKKSLYLYCSDVDIFYSLN